MMDQTPDAADGGGEDDVLLRDWAARVDALWADEQLSDAERVDAMERLAAERPHGDARALFELAGAHDSAGNEAAAEPLYRQALDAGLDEDLATQARIQLASTIRNLGKIDEALDILRDAFARREGSALDDAVAAFYALALSSAGEDRRALSIALETLAPHLTRYQRSVGGYARELLDASGRMPTANTAEGEKPRR